MTSPPPVASPAIPTGSLVWLADATDPDSKPGRVLANPVEHDDEPAVLVRWPLPGTYWDRVEYAADLTTVRPS